MAYEADPEATQLIVANRPAGSDEPAKVTTIDLRSPRGEIEIPAQSADDDVWTSAVAPGKGPSDSV